MQTRYTLREEHRAQFSPWAQRWIDNAMSCRPMDDADREAMRIAICGMYEAANLPAPINIVFVPSPLVARIAAGIAAGIWYLRDIAVDNAVGNAVRTAVGSAVGNAVDIAVGNAVDIAVGNAVDNAVDQYGRELANFFCDCMVAAWRLRDGGNHWSGWPAYLSFFSHVAQLDLPIFDKWQHYENAAIHGSWRYIHEKFCIVSDRPEFIRIDENRMPHCENGPSHQWRDGWKIYHWHGVAIPAEWIENKASLSAKIALTWENIEQRRCAIAILGWTEILREVQGVVLDHDSDPEIGDLIEADLLDVGKVRLLRVLCGTGREFAIPVPLHIRTALEGQAWTYGYDDARLFKKPAVRT